MSLHHGDCLDVMAAMEPGSVDAVVTDPPYLLRFMGKSWDSPTQMSGHATPDAGTVGFYQAVGKGGRHDGGHDNWRPNQMGEWHRHWAEAAYRVAKPSAYLLAFGGTRTVHRMTVAIEDAGWIIRDMLVWAYASGFPKSKASLKPAWEPIVMARKPGPLRELAIDACRIGTEQTETRRSDGPDGTSFPRYGKPPGIYPNELPGRWPANVILGDELFEPGVPGVVIAGSLTGTMTAWSSSPDSEPNPTASSVDNADRKSSRGVPGVSFPGSAIGPVGTQLDAWGTSTDTPKPDTGCSDGTTAGGSATSGSTEKSGKTLTDPFRGVTSSITETAMDSTTDSTTSSASAESSTTHITSLSEPGSTEWRDLASLSDDSANSRRNSQPVEGYSRFFLIPKADRADREPVLGGLSERVISVWGGDEDDLTPGKKSTVARRNVHPTVKPVDLMRHLVRLVTPTGGVVLDPFAGSGSTLLAAEMEGFGWIGIEKEAEYVAIAEARLNGTQRGLGLPA